MSKINDMGYVEADTLLDVFRNPYNVWKGEVIEAMARELIARRKKDEWISVKDRLPEENELVIVMSVVTGEYGIGRIEPIGSGYYQWAVGEKDGVIYLHGHSFNRITHWMPLPEPPEVTNDSQSS